MNKEFDFYRNLLLNALATLDVETIANRNFHGCEKLQNFYILRTYRHKLSRIGAFNFFASIHFHKWTVLKVYDVHSLEKAI